MGEGGSGRETRCPVVQVSTETTASERHLEGLVGVQQTSENVASPLSPLVYCNIWNPHEGSGRCEITYSHLLASDDAPCAVIGPSEEG